jgi:hypothetical protein
VPNNYWTSIDNQRAFVNQLRETLNITNLDDWYNVTTAEFRKSGGNGLLQYYKGSISRMLQKVYPEYLKHIYIHRCVYMLDTIGIYKSSPEYQPDTGVKLLISDSF